MISACPNCNKPLRFTDAHKEKLGAALAGLQPGKTVKFGCPMCKQPIELASDGMPPGRGGESVERGKTPPVGEKPDGTEKPAATAAPRDGEGAPPPRPPEAPDIKWLAEGGMEDKEVVENVPTAMVIVPDKEMEAVVTEFLVREYQIYVPASVDEAVKSMRFKNYEIVVYHSRHEDLPLNEQDLHKFMRLMSMNKRRHIFYILIGPEFQTLYDLQALANSANMVVNDSEVAFMPTLFKIGRMDYEELFSPYIKMLKEYGKS